MFLSRLYLGKTTVNAYFPQASKWYDYYTGKEAINSNGYATISAPRSHIPLHVRGGYILPTQDPAMNTDKSRKNSFGFVIAPDASGRAVGELYWDDGLSVDPVSNKKYNYLLFDYRRADNILESRVINNNLGASFTNLLNKIRIFDVPSRPLRIEVNGLTAHSSYTYDASTKLLEITNLGLPFNKYFYIKFF